MSRRALLVLLAVGGIGVGLYLWQGVFASEEERVRDALFDITDAFNEQRAGGVYRGLAKRIRIRDHTLKRDEIRAGLAREFIQQQRQGGARFRAEIVELEIATVHESDHETRTDVTVSYRLAERKGEGWGEAEERSVELEMVKHDDEGWQVVKVVGGDRLPYER